MEVTTSQKTRGISAREHLRTTTFSGWAVVLLSVLGTVYAALRLFGAGLLGGTP